MSYRSTILAVVILVISLTLFGCGSKTSENKSEINNEKVTIAIATTDINIGYPYATLPLEMGWYEEEGIDVNVVPGDGSQGVIQLLVSGKADLGVINTESGVMATANEQVDVKSVYAASRKNGYSFTVMEDSEINDVADLEGKNIGYLDLGSGGVPYAHARFKEAGVPVDSVEEMSVGYGAQAFEALKSGTVDAYVVFAAGHARGLVSGYDIKKLPLADWQDNMYNFNLYATDKYIKEDGDIIEKVGRAFAKATVFTKTNPEAVVDIFWDQYPEQAPKNRDSKALESDMIILDAQLDDLRAEELPVDFMWGSQEADAWEFQQQFMLDEGMIEEKVDVNLLFDNQFQDEFMDFNIEEIVKQAEEWEIN
ncbi:ABC transporter substrate-binding protein [Virgibacillus byunsanensis]|uniref:Thiamine pyrimidine synthase n=1 Tax=Virgibacillus byunsanensis TaxID=570945 RepID=A0ABW3LRE7_9BACI